MSSISILLADNDEIVRQCLRRAMESDPNLRVQWEADDGLKALHLAQQYRPSVILMDAHMARMDGMEVTRCLRRCCQQTRIILMSVYDQVRTQALDAGATGFVSKDSGCDAIRAAIYHSFQLCAEPHTDRHEENYHDAATEHAFAAGI
jgi:DNA-binding NarL/FixJ family response regulator